jgi:hypothetical protein
MYDLATALGELIRLLRVGKEKLWRDVKSFRQQHDMCFRQIALTAQDFRDHAGAGVDGESA